MKGVNDLKYYFISDITQKYDEINKKIIKFTKLYFFTMKNHSYQITQIENKLNEYNIKGEVKIKELLENQQGIIKELIKIINNILAKIRNDETSNKIEDFIPLKQKNIIMNNNLHIFALPNYNIGKINYTKNNIKENKGRIVKIRVNKSVDDKINNKKVLNQKKIIKIDITEQKHGKEYKNNINNNLPKQKNKKNFFEKYINKEKPKESKVLKHKILKSKSSSEISYKPKPQNKNLILKTNNINNTTSITNNNYYNNNYTIDEERNDNIEGISFINDRQNSCSCDINDNQEILKRKKKIKYRERRKKVLLTDNNGKNLLRMRSAKEIPIKKEFYLNYHSYFPYYFYNITNSSVDKNSEFSFNKRSNSSLSFFSGNLNNIIKENNRAIKSFENEIYSIPYINNGKRIIPTRFTKEVLNNSYKILNKYEQKMSKKY